MQESIYLFVSQRLADQIPELEYITEDLGELDAYASGMTDGYPIPPKAAFIGNAVTDWDDTGAGVQKGKCTFTVRLAVDCYHDPHVGSGTEDKVLDRLALNKRVYLALQGQALERGGDYLKRIKSIDYVLPGRKIVYETTFAYDIHDNSALIGVGL